MCDIPHIYALQKTLAIARTSAALDSVVEVTIGENRRARTGPRMVSDIPFLLHPAILVLVNAIPAMRQLHTVHLDHVVLPRVYLYTILSSPHLIHLTLHAVKMPTLSKFPLTKLRKLTLTDMTSWDAVEPLISQLSISLEYLEVRWYNCRDLRSPQLPPLPFLRELRHYYHVGGYIAMDLSALLRLGPHISHLHLSGNLYRIGAAPFPKSLRHLFVDEDLFMESIFGTDPLPWLISLNIRGWQRWLGFGHCLTLISFVRDRFPRITSLHFTIPWGLRDYALVMARSLHSVQALNLVIDATSGLDWPMLVPGSGYAEEVPTEYLRGAVLPAAIQYLSLEVVQITPSLEHSAACCTRWIVNNILHCVTGLGGPHLKSIDAVFVKHELDSEREQVLRMRWVKSINGGWQTEKYL